VSTGLERVFGEWARLRIPGDPHILTVGVRIDSDHSNGTHWNLTDTQEQRLIDLLKADLNALKEESQ
jgi:hypothetical protein